MKHQQSNVCKQFIDHGCSYAWNEMLCSYDLQILGILTQPLTIDTYIAHILKYKEYANEYPMSIPYRSMSLIQHLLDYRIYLKEQHIETNELQCFDGIAYYTLHTMNLKNRKTLARTYAQSVGLFVSDI